MNPAVRFHPGRLDWPNGQSRRRRTGQTGLVLTGLCRPERFQGIRLLELSLFPGQARRSVLQVAAPYQRDQDIVLGGEEMLTPGFSTMLSGTGFMSGIECLHRYRGGPCNDAGF